MIDYDKMQREYTPEVAHGFVAYLAARRCSARRSTSCVICGGASPSCQAALMTRSERPR